MHIWPQILMFMLFSTRSGAALTRKDILNKDKIVKIICIIADAAILYAGGFWDVLLK